MDDADSSPLQEMGGQHRNHCWGCGPDNPRGLQLRSFWDGDATVATWTPTPTFAAGPLHVLNGGIIATLLDCHGVVTAAADRRRRDPGRPATWYATSAMSVEYLRPTPIDEPVQIVGVLVDRDERSTTVRCTLASKGKARARADVTSVPVPPSWLAPPSAAGPASP